MAYRYGLSMPYNDVVGRRRFSSWVVVVGDRCAHRGVNETGKRNPSSFKNLLFVEFVSNNGTTSGAVPIQKEMIVVVTGLGEF